MALMRKRGAENFSKVALGWQHVMDGSSAVSQIA